jgi:hypothetical protein
MCCWDVNGGWWFFLYKRSSIHYLGVGKALFMYIGQRTTSNLSLRGPCFNSWTSKSDLIKPMWFLFISNRHVSFALLKAKHYLTFQVEHVSAKFDSIGHLCHSIVEHLDFRSVGLNIRQLLVGVFPSPVCCQIDWPWDIDDTSWPTWMLWWNYLYWRHIDHCCDCRIAKAICCEIFLQDYKKAY